MGKETNADGRKLVVLSGRTKGTAFFLTEPQVNAGRESDNTICLKGKRVSRYHAVLVRNNGEYTLRDVSPHIGTLLNGQPTKEAHLKLGDRICIGEFEMSYEAATAPAIDTPSATTPAQLDEFTAPCFPVAAARKESVEEVAAENPAAEYQRRIADLTERLGAVSQENTALAQRNSELQAKISELEASAGEVDRVETVLGIAPAEARGEREEISDLPAPVERVAVENEELQIAEAKTRREAVLANQRCVSEQTNEQFDRLRRSMVAKQDQKPDKTKAVRSLLNKFLRH